MSHTVLRLISLCCIVLVSACDMSENRHEASNADNVLWYKQPASEWLEALPLGNGRIGAMVYGGVEHDRLQLNEESLWAGVPFDPLPDEPQKYLRKVQELLVSRNIGAAYDLALEKLTAKPTSFRSYQPLGDLLIELSHRDEVLEYQRSLDMERGVAQVTYRSGSVTYTREMFVSAVDDVLVYHITSDTPGAITGSFTLTRETDVSTYTLGDNRFHLDGQIIDIPTPLGYDDNPGGSGPGGAHMKFFARFAVEQDGGTIRAAHNGIVVDNADEVTLILTAATDFNPAILDFDRTIDANRIVGDILDRASVRSYADLAERHAREHRAMFNRVELNVGHVDRSHVPTDERISAFADSVEDHQLITQFFQFGRYLLMSSSRAPGRLPANLQGIWSDKMWAAWESDYHLDLNLQMNYWPAEVGNLGDTVDSLNLWLQGLADRGRVTADKFFGARGWVAFNCCSVFGRATPSGSYLASQIDNGLCIPMGGAWMSLSLWRHFEFTRDSDFLATQAYPLLKGAAEFMLDFLIEDGTGYLVTAPTSSPENNYIDPATGKDFRITLGSTFDNSVIRALFEACIEAGEILDTDPEFRERLKSVAERLPPLQIGNDGTLQEWIEDYEEAEPGHRHLSHLFALYPGTQITPVNAPDLSKAFQRAMERRIAHGGGRYAWIGAWMTNLWARLHNGDKAHEHVSILMGHSLAPNLMNGKRLFQIDANLGATAGIAEMLLQSHADELWILPALPSAWPDGYVKGLVARGGFVVDIGWKDGELSSVVVHSTTGGECAIRYGDQGANIRTVPGTSYAFDGTLAL
jgi:alpha-L-fucosidase 2